jgi:WD40 repeat protein
MLLLPSYEGGRIERLAFTADGEWLVSVASHPHASLRNAPLRLWNRYTGLQRYVSDVPPDFGRCLALSEDGVLSAWEAFSMRGRALSLWDNIEATEQIQLPLDEPQEGLPTFSRDHTVVARVVRERGCIGIFSTITGAQERSVVMPGSYRVWDTALSPNADELAVVGADRKIVFLDLALEQPGSELVEPNVGGFILYSNNGSLLANLKWSGVAVWEPRATAKLKWRWDRKRPYCSAFAFSPNDQTLAAAFSYGSVIFWNATDGREQRHYQWDIGDLGAIAFAPDGLTCAAGGSDGRIVIWDLDE